MLDRLKTYVKEYYKLLPAHRKACSLLDLLWFYSEWNFCLTNKRAPLNDELPWITFAAIKFLNTLVTAEMKAFEYGSGGSTAFFARRAASVVSVEHNAQWHKRVGDFVSSRGYDNWTLLLVPPTSDPQATSRDPSNPDHYTTSHSRLRANDFKAYVSTIDSYPDGFFDVILIDGRSRPSCFKHAITKVKRGGYIVWDNTDRAQYARAMRIAPGGWAFLDFAGPKPYVNSFTRTSAWQAC